MDSLVSLFLVIGTIVGTFVVLVVTVSAFGFWGFVIVGIIVAVIVGLYIS